MHNSQGGVGMNDDGTGGGGTVVGTGYDDLLLFPNKTDVCLRCHAGTSGRYSMWSPAVASPNVVQANRGGGDFVFLEEDNLNEGHGGSTNPILGHEAGHNLISNITGIGADPVNTTAPGGTYLSTDMACTSCHDPHGTDAFRILYRDGQTGGGITWTSTIVAEGIGTRDGMEIDTNHNAYISGYSDWCAECHGDFHNAGASNTIHPAGEVLSTAVINAYNRYDGTQDCLDNPPSGGNPCGSGTSATAYLAMVPFEDPGAAIDSTTGAGVSSRVACVTCHRAHATSGTDAGRWDFNVTFLDEDGIESGSYALTNPYGNPEQRSLCNKCHSKDEFDTDEF
jgi:hypothetical protein